MDNARTTPQIVSAVPSPSAKAIPGEPGLWVFLFGDMLIFIAFFASYLVERAGDRELFAASRASVGIAIGLTNTIILLTSSILVVAAVNAIRNGARSAASRALVGTLACATAFVVLKIVEYSHLIGSGHGPGTNLYFNYFFILTGLHLSHVAIGFVTLGFMLAQARAVGAATPRRLAWIESCACYWHLVDLLWMVIFPLLYLVG